MAEGYRIKFEAWIGTLNDYLSGVAFNLSLPLDIRGTAFQIKVWKYLQKIPFGSVESYTQVAQGIGQPTSVRAVASACARNKLALAISCHRVIRGNGELAGYRWGLERKKALLELEKNSQL